jgi:hypothetical protein
MTEIVSPPIESQSESQTEIKASPLAPENFKDFNIQKRIVGYLVKKEPKILNLPKYDVDDSVKKEFDKLIVKSEKKKDVIEPDLRQMFM